MVIEREKKGKYAETSFILVKYIHVELERCVWLEARCMCARLNRSFYFTVFYVCARVGILDTF